ncbi:(R)-specific enoyl-CoA hydratase [Clostridium tetani]|uniref:(De)hydratase mit maoC domain n=2 Tax=Clostridium tetani TaxID=1513 RepID=Q897M7_CLOTE|nr:MaoC family dehydratase [Clostridium tetani]AAO35309.1 (de)hydratase mit maoC domain [Clostridium tetani E88]KGI41014.1 enoyl-CoA hydratase [Clostridium tetani]KGI45996.1 enoyl-CoA hydratase [Clostridium tetani]KHO36937.1 enoyl-CoA hydratase [Clostridium tetani]KIG20342.1 enoyl-CoA hydratase [Clostridium tetani]
MVGKTIETIKIGDKASFTKTLTETDVYLFAGISGDLNPAHVNQIESEKTMFKGRICHGILVSSLISTVLGMYLPGPGTIYLSQDLKFVAPVKIGDTVTATVEVIERNEERNRLILKTVVINEDGKVVVEGQAKVMPPKK